MTRFLFCKEGSAVWISHLDLQRMFQRAFNRAGIAIAHTAGFNPHAYVAMALPLSVGIESQCEILDCRLADETISPQEAAERLNHAGFPAGIHILEGYESNRKLKEIGAIQARIGMDYDQAVPQGAAERIQTLLNGPTLVVPKHSKKKGMVDTDVRSLLLSAQVDAENPQTLTISARLCAGEPSLNPELLVRAVERYLPADAPDFYRIRRMEIYDQAGAVFR